MFRQISIVKAKKLFNDGKSFIYLCPCKFRPNSVFNTAVLVSGAEWLDRASMYKDNPELWKGSIELTAWELMLNNWKYYNASNESGYYPHYYVQE